MCVCVCVCVRVLGEWLDGTTISVDTLCFIVMTSHSLINH